VEEEGASRWRRYQDLECTGGGVEEGKEGRREGGREGHGWRVAGSEPVLATAGKR
jgi:hypothetical protein